MSGFGVNDSLVYYEYEFDSEDADHAYDTSFSATDWPVFQMQRPLVDIAGIKILECQIPFSFYIFTTLNNKFQLVADGFAITNVTIPIGNYTATTLATALIAALTTASPTYIWTVTFSIVTGKFTFSFNGGSFYFVFGAPAGDPGVTNPRFALGFPGWATFSTGPSLEAPYVAQVTGPNYLYICSRALGTLVQLYLPASAELSQGGLGPEMAKIPITCNPGGIIYWQDPDPTKYFDTQSLMTIQQLDLYCVLGSDIQNPIVFNGASFNLKLGVLINAQGRTDESVNGAKRVRY